MMSSRVVAIMICTVWFVLQIFPYSKRPVCAGRGLVALISALCVLSEPVGRQPEAKSRSLRVMCCGASGIDAAMKWLRIFGGDHAPQPADKRGGNLFLVKIMLLDDTEIVHEISHWLDATKKVSKRIKGSPGPCTLYFGVKFYAADPCKLVEEITRYHFFLQVKKDILQGRLPVTFDLAAELGSYAVQYEKRRSNAFLFKISRIFEKRPSLSRPRVATIRMFFSPTAVVMGQVPAVAEMKFLEKIKWLDLYGVDLHHVMGEGNIEYFLGLTPSGVLVLKNKSKVGYYFWPRISKVYFQRRYFMLRVKDGASQERTFGFELPTRQACKHLWRCCVEHHAFFRLTGGGPATGLGNKPPATPKLTTKAFSFVSKFRYSGRTQKEAMEDAKRNARTPPPDFPRRVSKRQNYLKQRRIASGNPSFSDSELACDNKENLRSLNGSTGSSSTLPRIFLSVPKPKANSVILPDSPQSSRPGTRWNSQRGLFSNQSPRSIRSAEVSRRRLHKSEQTLGRSSSVDSITSNDSSRRCRKRHHHHSSRHNSDNESEKSTRSGVSNRHHHFYQNRASRNVMSGKESESDFSDPQAIQRRANQNVDALKHKTEDEVWRSAESGHDVEQRIRRTHRRPGTRWNSQRGLFSNQSPRSIRSAEVSRRRLHKSEQTLGRSSSVDSITSNDSSRRCRKRHHHHSSRHNSDNESEKSTRSGVSNRHHHFYQNRASRNVMSGKESESDFSDPQAIQRRANQNVDALKHKTEDEVWRSAESGHDVEQRIRRTHRSRSRSPGAAASRARNQLLPEQVRQHMAFNLVDPSEHGMSVDQLRDIPYTKVETDGRPLKIHYSPQAKKVYVKKGVGTPAFPSKRLQACRS
ncbi:unnamed protein product [Notodromas monacha]|uniref:FERM domain-containing protein n=1 Tax=Notodromas monacha TaxID=399045 RepID=A0A7R9BM01_9CRUS|nr:unnamed protein product [Notodromas monacha]CAG0916604.1 unnamed protein product [Notodromas monacha]